MTASPIKLGSEFLINTYTNDTQTYPSITSLADGGYVVTWTSKGQDRYRSGIYGQRYDANGIVDGAEFQINTETNSNHYRSSIASLTDGGFVVTWVSDDQDGSSLGIYGQRYDASGGVAGAEFQVNTYIDNGQYASSVTSFTDGGFVVTWASEDQDDGWDGIYGQRYDASGASFGAEFQINTNRTVGEYHPAVTSITSVADGGFVVIWVSERQGGGPGGAVFGQRYDASGATFGAEFQISTYTDSYQYTSSVTSLADGGFVVTWGSYRQDGESWGLYGQRYDASGATLGVEFQINTYTNGAQWFSSVTSLADGGFVVTWESENQDGYRGGIYGQRYDASGATVGMEFQINTYTNGDQSETSVTSLANGGFVVTWQSLLQDGSGYGIYGQQFAAQLFGTAGDDVIFDTEGANWMHGQDGDDTLNGGSGRDKVFGGAGKDTLSGGGARDKLYGGKGADILFGNSANDKLYGNNGADRLDGGKGKDILSGGAGADVFVFAKTSDSENSKKADIIKDFEIGVDHIDLSAIGYLSFIGSSGFSGTAGELRVGSNGTDSFVRVDNDGDGSANMKIVLEGVTGITVGDFIL